MSTSTRPSSSKQSASLNSPPAAQAVPPGVPPSDEFRAARAAAGSSGAEQMAVALAKQGSRATTGAWPWTLNVAGRGFYFRTQEDAFKAIRSLIANGRCDST